MTRYLVYSFFLMLISPILTVINGLKIKNGEVQKWILILAITFYGSTITISPGNDGYRHLKNVTEHYSDLSFSEFFSETINILTFKTVDGTKGDLYIHFLSYFVGAILQMPWLFFVIVSFVYGYFYTSSVLKVLRIIPGYQKSFLFFAFSIVFVLLKGVEGINTVRTWTGLWVLFYAAYSYFETKKIKYLLLLFVPPFIHLGYFIMAIPTWIVVLAGKKFKLIYVLIFGLSLIVNLPRTEILGSLEQTEVGENRSSAYYVEDVESFNENRVKKNQSFHVVLQKEGINNYPFYLLTLTIIFSGIYFFSMNSIEASLFSVGLVTKALSNFTPFLFALSARSGLIATVFIIASAVLMIKRGYIGNTRPIIWIIFHIVALLYIPLILFKLADIIYYISFYMIALPFIPWISSAINFSIRDFIGFFI